MTGRRRSRPRTLTGILVTVLVLAGCDQLQAADDLVTPIHVVREPGAVWVRAPSLSTPETLVVLCPSRPDTDSGPLNDPGPARVELPKTCHPYGRFESAQGLDAHLAFADLVGASRADLDAASEWWIILVSLTGDTPGAYYETNVEGGPIEPASAAPG